MRFRFLCKKYPRFVYRSFDIKTKGKNLKISFDFHIEPDIDFNSKIIIKNVSASSLHKIGKGILQNLAFHCGLAEMPTYWKATCSPEIVIEAGHLSPEQIRWWQDLFRKGMAQFFYENRINFEKPGLLNINNAESRPPPNLSEKKYSNVLKNIRIFSPSVFKGKLKNRYLVPVAGGRDSIVTVELLKKKRKPFAAFCVNPTKEAKAVMKAAGIKNKIIVQRKIDPRLLELNKKGYLNGHTPFTSVLSFLSVFCAVLFDYRHIAFSNEKSADEGNLTWRGMVINHQYSKSSEFESKFRVYARKYLAKNINYFSILRPYSDLEISKMFAKYQQYFSAFSSCNAGRKLGKRWCGECAKCLFVYMTLYPYLSRSDLNRIFGRDLFENEKLLPILRALIDLRLPKPFECVGTKKECRRAFRLSLMRAKKLSLRWQLRFYDSIL